MQLKQGSGGWEKLDARERVEQEGGVVGCVDARERVEQRAQVCLYGFCDTCYIRCRNS